MSFKPINAPRAQQAQNKICIGSIVEYENHGKPVLSIVSDEVKDKFDILNGSGKVLKMPAARLYLYPGQVPKEASSHEQKIQYLENLERRAAEIKTTIDLEELWELVSQNQKEISVVELTELALSQNTCENQIAIRRALLEDNVFFKRIRNNYEPRSRSVVEELKKKEKVEKAKKEKLDSLVEALVQRIKGNDVKLPSSIVQIEELAAAGKNSEHAKEASSIVEEVARRCKIELSGRIEHRAFFLLEQARHFDKNVDLNLIRYQRRRDFSEQVLKEADRVISSLDSVDLQGREDLQNLFCITIDSETTKDFDDAISLEQTAQGHRVGIHISQVAGLIASGSELEKEVFKRASTIYCSDQVIPMLPASLSDGALSLVEGEARLALSLFVELDGEAEVLSYRLTPSLIRVAKRLSFEDVNAVLCEQAEMGSRDLEDLLLKLWQIGTDRETKRILAGGTQFNRREMLAKLGANGKVILEVGSDDTPAHKLVGEFMILANEVSAKFARDNKIPLIFRTQEAADVNINEQGEHINEGPAREFYKRSFIKKSLLTTSAALHSSLGLEAYAQTTSPLRRVSDYINQKQILTFLKEGKPFYSDQEVQELLEQSENKVSEVFNIQRQRNRFWLLKYLMQERIKEITGTVVRNEGAKQLVELDIIYTLYPFVSANKEKKKLGEVIRLKIEKIDPRNDRLLLSELYQSRMSFS